MIYFCRGKNHLSAVLMNDLVKWISEIYPQVASTLLTMAVTAFLTLTISTLFNRLKKLETSHVLIPDLAENMKELQKGHFVIPDMTERMKELQKGHEVILKLTEKIEKLQKDSVAIPDMTEKVKELQKEVVVIPELTEKTHTLQTGYAMLSELNERTKELLERMRKVEAQCTLIPELSERMRRVEIRSTLIPVIVHKVGCLKMAVEKSNWRMEQLQRIVKGLEFFAIRMEEKMDGFEKRIDGIEQTLLLHTDRLYRLEGTLEKLLIYMKNKNPKMDVAAFIAKSPLQLSALGWDILEKTGGKKIIDDNFTELFRLLDSQRDKFRSPLDLQHHATRLILELIDTEMCVPLRDYVYYNPIYVTDNGEKLLIDLVSCADIMGIYLRNKYSENLSPRLGIEWLGK